MNRAEFLSGGAKAGAALAFAGGLGGIVVAPAAADTLSDSDLAWARLAVAAELLATEFYTQLTAASLFKNPNEAKAMKRALQNEQQHYPVVAQPLTDAAQVPAVAGDFDFTFPKDAFTSLGAAAELGRTLETAFLGIYLGGVDQLQNGPLRTTFARVAASEAEHLTLFAGLLQRNPIGVGMPATLDQAGASDVLDQYLG